MNHQPLQRKYRKRYHRWMPMKTLNMKVTARSIIPARYAALQGATDLLEPDGLHIGVRNATHSA